MEFDDYRLRTLWERQAPPTLVRDLSGQIRRHRRLMISQRLFEAGLTLAAIGLYAWSIRTGGLSPSQWLLLPFFSVFLIVSWSLLLRQRHGARATVSERVAIYAALRQRQIRHSLRNLKLAEYAAAALLVYAALALGCVLLFGTSPWRSAAGVLLAWSVLWHVGTYWLTGRRRRSLRREYRAMRRIA